MLIRFVVTEGAEADSQYAAGSIEGISAEHLLADRGYDSDDIITQVIHLGIHPVISPRKNRKVQRDDDKHLYKLRQQVENAFLHLKQWRGIATRYAKHIASFIAAMQIRCIAIWENIL